MKLPTRSLAPARRRALMSLATLAAAAADGAEPGRILCVVPSRWPPSRSLEAVASTWLKDCDSVTIAVSARQFNASRGATVARRKSARKFITRNVAVTHDGAGFTPWLPIRAAVEWAAARRGFSSSDGRSLNFLCSLHIPVLCLYFVYILYEFLIRLLLYFYPPQSG